ncbi:unnamed protein product [Toxocara canis]|uniref:Uncharacterized protein n=1 Tax=Toxocara canis TaxID=6265 RepID=A0A183UD55_TOXCA|nr:unnamed protein product [Toxocara canis]
MLRPIAKVRLPGSRERQIFSPFRRGDGSVGMACPPPAAELRRLQPSRCPHGCAAVVPLLSLAMNSDSRRRRVCIASVRCRRRRAV